MALVVMVLTPMLVVVVSRFGHSYTPASDIGAIDLRVREVWSLHPPLVGPYSNQGWNHPGPLLFYLLAVPSLLAGRAAWGTQVGAALLQAAAIIWLARLAWRRGGAPLLAVAMVGMALLARAIPFTVIRDPWNPHVALPFFALFVFQTWLLATGDARVLPGAVAVATFLVQTHVGYAPLVGAAFFVAIGYRVADSRRRPSDLLGQSWRRPVRWALVVGGVLWIPPVLDCVLHPPGNLWSIASYFLHPGRSVTRTVGLEHGARLLAAEFTPRPDWLGGAPDTGFLGVVEGKSPIALLIPAVLLAVAFAVARHRRSTSTGRFLVCATVLLLAGWLALARVQQNPFPYLFLWRAVLAIAVVLGCGWALVAGSSLVRVHGRALGAVAALLVVVWGSGYRSRDGLRYWTGDTVAERATASLARQARHHGVPKGGVILRLEWSSYLQLQRGIFDELRRHDAPVYVDEDVAYQYANGLARSPQAVRQVWWVAESTATLAELTSQPGARLVATWSPLQHEDERRLRALSAKVYRELRAAHRLDLVQQLNGEFLGLFTKNVKGVDHAAVRQVLRLNQEIGRKGAIRAGIVAFSAPLAPVRLSAG